MLGFVCVFFIRVTKTYWLNIHETWWKNVAEAKKEHINFWSGSELRGKTEIIFHLS